MTLTRRRVLAAIAAAGGAGALTGSTSGALLRNSETLGASLTTGLVDIVVEYWQDASTVDPENPDGVVDGPRLDIPVGTVDEDSPGSTLLRIALPQDEGPNNPASVWLRTECPERVTLAEFLTVRLFYSDASGARGDEIVSGSLRQVADALRTGVRLDGDPATDGDDCLTDEVFVLVEYELGAYIGSESVSLPLFVVGTQCRNADPSVNPFPADATGAACEPAYTCECCWDIGKVEVPDRDENFEAGRLYPFDEGLAGYAIEVVAADGDSGVAFELVATDGGPVLPLCSVLVKGGSGDSLIYSRPENGEYDFDTSVLTGATDDGIIYAPENPNNGKRYGISHVVVGVCTPLLPEGGCPEDVATTSKDGSRGSRSKTDEGGETK
ncbi:MULTISPECIES: hypothetical protein [Salinibaculum]|uniref:hypothetical protein n=1 Tax=Salinibaculum TaxID=2732368 RepID=UPI0030D42D56